MPLIFGRYCEANVEVGGPMQGFFRNQAGSVAVYAAVFTSVAVGAGAVAVDVGRLTVLRSQMQNTADARAMAAAVQLDGQSGAQARALAVANSTMVAESAIPADGSALTVAEVNFYSAIEPMLVAATGDVDSLFVEVKLAAKQVEFLLRPVLALITQSGAASASLMAAEAIAGPDPFICNAPPLMICDFLEAAPPVDLTSPANYGRQIRLKSPPSSGTWAPGNFSHLALPDGSSGAVDIEGALAAVEPEDCYQYDVTTATGNMVNKIKIGINARFDLPGNPWPYPAPDVINFGRDDDLISDPDATLGSGTWDIQTYWTAKHPSLAMPAWIASEVDPMTGLTSTVARYQVYLWEIGVAFARDDRQTLYPVPGTLDAGFSVVPEKSPAEPSRLPVAASPTNADNPDYDGVPSEAIAPNEQARRLLQVAQLQCVADNIHGHGTYSTGGDYLEVFVTETVKDPPNAAIYGELVRALSPTNYANFHANVRLVR